MHLCFVGVLFIPPDAATETAFVFPYFFVETAAYETTNTADDARRMAPIHLLLTVVCVRETDTRPNVMIILMMMFVEGPEVFLNRAAMISPAKIAL